MLATLEPCPSCARHVRVAESKCPFCSAALTVRVPRRLADVSRLSRAARVAFGAALAAGCASDPGPAPVSPDPAPTVVPAYGAPAPTPPPPEGEGDGEGEGEGEGSEGGGQGSGVAPEPPPPPDQPPPQTGPQDPGAARPLYGLPAPPQ